MLKTTLLLLAASAMLIASPGCSTVPSDRQLATLKAVSAEAAYVGCALRLENEPDSRAQFGVAMTALDVVLKKGDFTPGALQQALKELPVLAGSSGAVIESGAVVFILVSGFVDVDSAPRVKAVAEGIYSGLERAMSRPTGPATRALAETLPAVCAIPAR